MRGEKLSNFPSGTDVVADPNFRVMPPLRCGATVGDREVRYCGRLAVVMRLAPASGIPRFFCQDHEEQGDLPIAGELVCRRITLTVDVLFAGVGLDAGSSHDEAVTRLQDAVQALGGCLNLHSVGSSVGRFTPPPSPERRRRGRGGP